MRRMFRSSAGNNGRVSTTISTVALLACGALVAGCLESSQVSGDERIVVVDHSLLPTTYGEGTQIAAGAVTGFAPEQPIPFPHYTHAILDGIECEYCHTSARKSIHAGLPSVGACMGCHRYVRTESPYIQKLKEYADSGEPIPWKKVHDLPDYVYFAHQRHVQAGVACQECHGNVQLQGGKLGLTYGGDAGGDGGSTGAGEGDGAVPAPEGREGAVMVRESTLQMGWCLSCHATHPSIAKNYGDKENLRRAELKDCWTCHK